MKKYINEEYHGDLEIIVNYGGHGLVKSRKTDVLAPEMSRVLYELMKATFSAILEMEATGKIKGKNTMSLFSDEQFKQA